jgi:methionyl-tRNA synthetase
MNKHLITTAIPYMNGAPHAGHALEMIITDVIVRGRRLLGEDIFFLTGSDEHGSKILKTAE